jgi:hypothetical protein
VTAFFAGSTAQLLACSNAPISAIGRNLVAQAVLSWNPIVGWLKNAYVLINTAPHTIMGVNKPLEAK